MAIVPKKYRGTQIYGLVYCRLLDAARKKEGASYEEIGQIMGLAPGGDAAQEVGQLLGEINEDEHNHGRPMLSAVAVEPTTKDSLDSLRGWIDSLGRQRKKNVSFGVMKSNEYTNFGRLPRYGLP